MSLMTSFFSHQQIWLPSCVKELKHTSLWCSTISYQSTSLEEKLNSVTKDIHIKLNAVKTTAQEASTYACENREEIESLKFRLAELNETVSNQAITIHQLDIEIEDLKNRSLKKTIWQDMAWDDTKMVLVNKISKNMQDFSKDNIIKNIEWTHWVTTANRNPSTTSASPFLVAKLQIGTCQKKLNLPLLKLTSMVCLPDVLKVSGRKKKCCSEVPSRSQRARPISPRLCKIPSHTND